MKYLLAVCIITALVAEARAQDQNYLEPVVMSVCGTGYFEAAPYQDWYYENGIWVLDSLYMSWEYQLNSYETKECW